jgi:Tfp pilus assembly protein PilO
VDSFIETLDAKRKAGVELRRYTAKPVPSKEYYSEVPFDMELDGPYYSMLNFFDRVGKLERIVNISGLLVSNHEKSKRGEGEAYLSVRAERERNGDVYGDHVLQSRLGAGRSGAGTKPAVTGAGAGK